VTERRRYTKVLRAAAEEETRSRIVNALIELHEEIGPARTTVSAVASRAGVERLTVYRHFPDEPSMLQACSARWRALNPPPDVPSFSGGDPRRWFRRVLLRLYEWYRCHARMLTNIVLDAARMPAVEALAAERERQLDSLAAAIDRSWQRRDPRRRATIRHALDFSTWNSLSRLTRSDREAVKVVISWLEAPPVSKGRVKQR
jgi:AcrR family transcriptional regulator